MYIFKCLAGKSEEKKWTFILKSVRLKQNIFLNNQKYQLKALQSTLIKKKKERNLRSDGNMEVSISL